MNIYRNITSSLTTPTLRTLMIITAAAFALAATAGHLVILHTNDTHSSIDAENGTGGVLQRKVLIDSIRKVEKNVILVDAGDIVQGSLYFKLFGGEVEYNLMDLMGYDIQIIGNHELDNGIDSLAHFYPSTRSVKLSSNYNFDATPLKGVFRPYYIKKVDGKKIGFLGLNIDPDGLVSEGNATGLKYTDVIEAANRTADFLRYEQHCDLVVAISHIGYEDKEHPELVTDPKVACSTRNIDLIIGGHSHTTVSPENTAEMPCRFTNLDGREVLVVQTGRYGDRLGKVDIDLNNPNNMKYSLINVKNQNPEKFDKRIIKFLEPYKHRVDSVNARPVGVAAADMLNDKRYDNSVRASNLISDIALWYGTLKLDSLTRAGMADAGCRSMIAVMNSGGVRRPIYEGQVTEGNIYSVFPFINRFWIMKFTGRQLYAMMCQSVEHGGIGFSENVVVSLRPGTREVRGMTIDGAPIDPDRDYYVSTIDYLGKGGDRLDSFKVGQTIWCDSVDMCAPVMRYVLEHNVLGIPIGISSESRIIEAESIEINAE